MRKPTQIVAPALIVGALVLGGYRFAVHVSPASGFVAQVASTVVVTTVAPVEVTTQAPAADLEPTATVEPTSTARPTATVEPTATAQPTATTPPTATAQPVAKRAPAGQPVAPAAAAENLVPPSRIVAPAIGLDAKVVTVGWHEVKDPDGSSHTEWDVASYAAGWQKNSALPGQVGNTVLSGHNNIEGEVFRNLEKFQPGDQITLYAGSRTFTYIVTDRFVVADKNVPYEQRLANAKWIGPFDDERLTLVSCWPPTNNTHRIFVVAKPAKQQG